MLHFQNEVEKQTHTFQETNVKFQPSKEKNAQQHGSIVSMSLWGLLVILRNGDSLKLSTYIPDRALHLYCCYMHLTISVHHASAKKSFLCNGKEECLETTV